MTNWHTHPITPSKRLKMAFLLQERPFLKTILVNLHPSWSVGVQVRAQHMTRFRQRAFRVHYHTYALCIRPSWAQVFAPAYGRE